MLSQTLRTLVSTLDRLEVCHALIRGYALAFHEVVRATEDLDFMVDRAVIEISTLARQLEEEGLKVECRRGWHGDPVVGVIVVEISNGQTVTFCDLLFPSRRWQAEAVRNATRFEVDGLAVRVVQAGDLFLLKLYAGGPQDLLDAAELYRRQDSAAQKAWEAAASKLRMANEYKRSLKFLKEAEPQ